MEIFSTYGTIKNVEFQYDRLHPHLGRGFAYVEFATPDEAENAMKHMDGGNFLKISYAQNWMYKGQVLGLIIIKINRLL